MTPKRPTYENAESLKTELEYANKLAKLWDMTAMKLPLKYQLDFAMINTNKDVKALVEIKHRNIPSTKYPTFVLSLSKWTKGITLNEITGIPFILAVKWVDRYGIYKYHTGDDVDIKFNFRTAAKWRNDWQDNEPVVEIPIDWFEEVND
jgi:hypothetical protein